MPLYEPLLGCVQKVSKSRNILAKAINSFGRIYQDRSCRGRQRVCLGSSAAERRLCNPCLEPAGLKRAVGQGFNPDPGLQVSNATTTRNVLGSRLNLRLYFP